MNSFISYFSNLPLPHINCDKEYLIKSFPIGCYEKISNKNHFHQLQNYFFDQYIIILNELLLLRINSLKKVCRYLENRK